MGVIFLLLYLSTRRLSAVLAGGLFSQKYSNMSFSNSSQDISGLTIDSADSSLNETSSSGAVPCMSVVAAGPRIPKADFDDDDSDLLDSGNVKEDLEAIQAMIDLEDQKRNFAIAKREMLKAKKKVIQQSGTLQDYLIKKPEK